MNIYLPIDYHYLLQKVSWMVLECVLYAEPYSKGRTGSGNQRVSGISVWHEYMLAKRLPLFAAKGTKYGHQVFIWSSSVFFPPSSLTVLLNWYFLSIPSWLFRFPCVIVALWVINRTKCQFCFREKQQLLNRRLRLKWNIIHLVQSGHDKQSSACLLSKERQRVLYTNPTNSDP